MLKRVPLGEFRPDLPPSDQLIVATNVRPSPTGYLPVASFATITPALSGISGGAAFRSSAGETSFLGGDHNSLNRYSGVTWSSLIVALSADRWRFAQFGDNVIGVYGGQPVSYNLLTGAAAFLTGNPPDADMVAVVRDFVVVAGDPASTLTVTWSGSNDSTEWTPLENQSDSQPMLDGGEVMGLAGGEYGVVLQRNAIKRMTYQGGEVIFSFDEISSNTGCMAKGSVTQAGRLVFFLSERGFMICDGNDVRPIGEDKVDRTFFATYSRQDIEAGIYAAVDPARNVVMWSMPGSPGMLWCYYWSQERWATIETDVRLLFSGFTANVGLEAVSVLYPDLDTMPVSLDDPTFAGGNPLLLIATTGGVVGTLAGPALPATLAIARSELAPGRCRIRAVRPMTDAVNVTIRIEGRARGGATPLVETFGQMRQNGEVSVRVNAQTFAITAALTGPWTYIQSLDVDYEAAGRR